MYETVHSFPWSHEGCFSSAIFIIFLWFGSRRKNPFLLFWTSLWYSYDCNARMLLPTFNLSWPTFDALQLSDRFDSGMHCETLGKKQQKLSFRACWVYLLVCLLTLFEHAMALLLLSTWLSSGLRSAQSCSSLVSGETIQREMLQSFTSCFAIDMILIHLSLLWFGTSKPKWNLSRSSLNRVMDGYSMLWQEVSECGQFRCTSLVADPSSSRRLDMQSSICSSQRGVQEYVRMALLPRFLLQSSPLSCGSCGLHDVGICWNMLVSVEGFHGSGITPRLPHISVQGVQGSPSHYRWVGEQIWLGGAGSLTIFEPSWAFKIFKSMDMEWSWVVHSSPM